MSSHFITGAAKSWPYPGQIICALRLLGAVLPPLSLCACGYLAPSQRTSNAPTPCLPGRKSLVLAIDHLGNIFMQIRKGYIYRAEHRRISSTKERHCECWRCDCPHGAGGP